MARTLTRKYFCQEKISIALSILKYSINLKQIYSIRPGASIPTMSNNNTGHSRFLLKYINNLFLSFNNVFEKITGLSLWFILGSFRLNIFLSTSWNWPILKSCWNYFRTENSQICVDVIFYTSQIIISTFNHILEPNLNFHLLGYHSKNKYFTSISANAEYWELFYR